jgi:hypothetical protein
MNRKNLGWTLPLMIACNAALAEPQDIVVSPCNNVATTFALKPGQAVPANTDIEVAGAPGNVFWAFSNSGGSTACSGGPLVFTCAGMTVTVPNPDTAVPASTKIAITGSAGALGQQGAFTLTATDATNTSRTCDGKYLLHVVAEGGGWGDPHLTTVDGVHYDFQSAGEFTALRQDGLEIQTRQTAVPSATVPISDAYTGLRSCVSIYTAVAARIGSNRVTLQPAYRRGIDRREEGRTALQLRVNGKLVTLGTAGINLVGEGGRRARLDGRIVRTSADTIEITDARGTQLVVTEAFWPAQQKRYLTLNVYQTSAVQGVMGAIAPGSWLPALPDGSSLGPRPASAQQRYQDLYEKFADAWRVTAATSLFDYAPGTDTSSFTLDEWPREDPPSCDLRGQTAARPASAAVAQQACSVVADPVKRADCVFDVRVTGHTGFAASYRSMQRVKPHGTGWQHVTVGRRDPGGVVRPVTPPITVRPR